MVCCFHQTYMQITAYSPLQLRNMHEWTQVTLTAAQELRDIIDEAEDVDTLVQRHADFVEHLADRALLSLTVCSQHRALCIHSLS